MTITLNDISNSLQNVINSFQNTSDQNIFIENKQEDHLSTLIAIELTRAIGSNTNYCISQFAYSSVNRNKEKSDIAEINGNTFESHIECKYFYSTDFSTTTRAKHNWATKLINTDIEKIQNANLKYQNKKNYLIVYCIHLLNVSHIYNNINLQSLTFGQNIFTYINNYRINSNTINKNFLYSNAGIFKANSRIENRLQDEINLTISNLHTTGHTTGNCISKKFHALTCGPHPIKIQYKLLCCPIELL